MKQLTVVYYNEFIISIEIDSLWMGCSASPQLKACPLCMPVISSAGGGETVIITELVRQVGDHNNITLLSQKAFVSIYCHNDLVFKSGVEVL